MPTSLKRCHYVTCLPVFNKRTVSISLTEIIVVFVVALLLFGPEQLPVIARGLGKIASEFKRTSDSLRREFYNSVYTPADELRRDVASEARSLRALKAEVLAPPPGSAPANVRPAAAPIVASAPAPESPTNSDVPAQPPRAGGADA